MNYLPGNTLRGSVVIVKMKTAYALGVFTEETTALAK
jgi:hypothetical protein